MGGSEFNAFSGAGVELDEAARVFHVKALAFYERTPIIARGEYE
jgi:hypothetical protein